MPEPVVKRLQVTFNVGLPLGTHASFKHDGEWWIAYPSAKYTRIVTCIDRMLGIYSMIRKDMLRWINNWPDDATRVLAILDRAQRAQLLALEIIDDKAKAATS